MTPDAQHAVVGLALALGGVVVIIAAVLMLVAGLSRISCDRQWADSPHRYGLIEGCMVEWGGRWVPASAIRIVE